MQVEGVLLAHPAVVQAAAFGIENQVMGEMVHAAVTLTPGVQVSHAVWLHGPALCRHSTTIGPRSMNENTVLLMISDDRGMNLRQYCCKLRSAAQAFWARSALARLAGAWLSESAVHYVHQAAKFLI